MGKIYAVEVTQMGKKSAVLQMHVDYEHVSVLYTISFNDRLDLQGFFMKKKKGETVRFRGKMGR